MMSENSCSGDEDQHFSMDPYISVVKEEGSSDEDKTPNDQITQRKPLQNHNMNDPVGVSEPELQFPKPIVIPKIELERTKCQKPTIVDMLDIDTENESDEDVENTDAVESAVENIQSVIDICLSNKTSADSHLESTISQTPNVSRVRVKTVELINEEIDLGTNILTEDGDIKISNLANNLALHLPKSYVAYAKNNKDVATIDKSPPKYIRIGNKETNTSVCGKNNSLDILVHKGDKKICKQFKRKNVATKKTTTTVNPTCSTRMAKYLNIKTYSSKPFDNYQLKVVKPTKTYHAKPKSCSVTSVSPTPSEEIVDIVKNEPKLEHDEKQECFGNKIIVGKKPKLLKKELKVVAEDCFTSYINSPNYCSDCNILFTTYRGFDIHYIEKHLNNITNKATDNTTSPQAIANEVKNIDEITDLSKQQMLLKTAVQVDNSKKKSSAGVTRDGSSKCNLKLTPKYAYQCKLCSNVIKYKLNVPRHLKNVHHVQPDNTLYFRIDMPASLIQQGKLKSNSNFNPTRKGKSGIRDNVTGRKFGKIESNTLLKRTSETREVTTNIKNTLKAQETKTNSKANRKKQSLKVVLKSGFSFNNVSLKTYKGKGKLKKSTKTKEKSITTTDCSTKLNKQNVMKKASTKNIADIVAKVQNNHCVHCDKTFADKEQIINHLYNLLLPKLQTCEICDKEFDSEDKLKAHLKTHNDDVKEVKVILVRLSQEEIKKYTNKIDVIDSSDEEIDINCSDNEINDYNQDSDASTILDCSIANISTHSTKFDNDMERLIERRDLVQISLPSEKEDGKDQNDNHSKHQDIDQAEKSKSELLKAWLQDFPSPTMMENSPIPKTVVFKCADCDLHYISCGDALNHLKMCNKSLPAESWKCLVCQNNFTFSNKDIHEKQHLYDKQLAVYTLEKSKEDILQFCHKVLHCCPKCGVHYLENLFWTHYQECETQLPDSYYCSKCDMLIAESHRCIHTNFHANENFNVEDFIFIEYEVIEPKQNLDADLIRADKDGRGLETIKTNDIEVTKSPKNKDEAKEISNITEREIKRLGIDVCEVVSKTENDFELEDLEIKYDSSVVRLIFCDTCGTYITPFKPNNLAHFYGVCSNLAKTSCTICGLTFTRRSIFSHRKLHRIIRNFSILNIVFYNMQFEQIDPNIPDLPKCQKCFLTFECLESSSNHVCGERKYKSCFYCGEDFNELAYKTHILFHDYVKNKTILPMSSDDLLKLNSIIEKKAIGNTYKFTFYQCEECSVAVDEVNRDVHKNIKGDCVDLIHTYKKCLDCNLTIMAKDFVYHSAKHQRNSTFVFHNYNIIPFRRDVYGADEYANTMKKYKERSSWCNICKIHVYESGQRHSLKHSNNDNILTKDKKHSVKRKLENIKNVKEKRKKVDGNESDDSNIEIVDTNEVPILEIPDDNTRAYNIALEKKIVSGKMPTEKPSLFKCKNCNIVLLEQSESHKCDTNRGCKTCDICKLKFYYTDYESHQNLHDIPEFVFESAVTVFDNKSNDLSLQNAEFNVETIYKCLCGLHFLTEAGIYEHYPHCSINPRSVKQNCTKCNLLFTPPVLFNHLVTHHSKNKDFKCRIVDLTPYTSKSRDEIYQCEKCCIFFVVKKLCEIHVAVCSGSNKNYKKCSTCNLNFDSSTNTLHRRKHHMISNLNADNFDKIIIKSSQETDLFRNQPNEIKSNNATVNLKMIEDLDLDCEIIAPHSGRSIDKILEFTKLENFTNVVYKCVECDLHFTHSRSFTAHKLKNHALNIIVVACQICKLKFSTEACVRHEYVHHTKMNLQLEDLVIKTSVDKVIKQKITAFDGFTLSDEAKAKILRNKELNTNKIYKCSKCNLYFLTPNTLFSHMFRSKHELKTSTSRCDKCNIMMTMNSLERHKFIHHEINNYEFKDLKIKEDITYCYTKTPRRYFDKSRVNLNIYSNKIFKCLKCNLAHITFAALCGHILERNHNVRTRKIQCNICNEVFTPLGLAKHKYVHHEMFKLNIDDFEFVNEVSLAHLIEKRRDEIVVRETLLKNSKRKIIYRCKECEVCFVTRKTARSHMRAHLPILKKARRPCSVCGLVFTQNSITFHVNNHHKQKKLTLNDFYIQDLELVKKPHSRHASQNMKHLTY